MDLAVPATILADSILSVLRSFILSCAICFISISEIDAITSLPGVFDAFFNLSAFLIKNETGGDFVSNVKLLS